jgi:integrase
MRDGGGLVFSEPKNASRRTVDLPQRAVEALRSHRKRQLEEQLRVGSSWQDNGLVFPTTIGTLVDAQNVVNRHFKPLLKRTGLPSIRWHDLRHTYATLLLARAPTRPMFRSLLGMHRCSSPSTGTLTGCRQWAAPPRQRWTTRSQTN